MLPIQRPLRRTTRVLRMLLTSTVVVVVVADRSLNYSTAGHSAVSRSVTVAVAAFGRNCCCRHHCLGIDAANLLGWGSRLWRTAPNLSTASRSLLQYLRSLLEPHCPRSHCLNLS